MFEPSRYRVTIFPQKWRNCNWGYTVTAILESGGFASRGGVAVTEWGAKRAAKRLVAQMRREAAEITPEPYSYDV